MDVQPLVKRRTIPITFSRDFEALLLANKTDQLSISHDLEQAAQTGLARLAELEDVHDLKHVAEIKQLVAAANHHSTMPSGYFTCWYIAVAEDLLDEVDLLILTHGADLKILGLRDTEQGTIIVLLALAGLLGGNFSEAVDGFFG